MEKPGNQLVRNNFANESDDSLDKIDVTKCSLPPDHPLLENFQKALKEQLLLQISRVKNDIFEYENETKKKEAEKEQLGVKTYEVQQLVCQQQKVIESLSQELETITAAKEEIDEVIAQQKIVQKELKQKYYLTEKANKELQNEIHAVNLLVHQMSQWENKIESSITINQRIAEKTRKDKLQFAAEKRAQDVLIYKMMTDIWKLESEIEMNCLQKNALTTEVEEVQQAVAQGNTKIEALQAEYRCLMHSWNSVVLAISNRDKVLDCLNEERNTQREKLKSVNSEIEQIKKLIKKQLAENENYTLMKSRMERDLNTLQMQTEDETNKKNTLERMMYEMQSILDQTEKDYQEVYAEYHKRDLLLNAISKQFHSIATKKMGLEEKVLRNLENQADSNKLARTLCRVLKETKGKRRDVNIIMIEAENKHSRMCLDIESQKYNNNENRRLLQDLQQHQSDLEKEDDSIQEKIQKFYMLFRTRERQVEVLNNKLERAYGKPEHQQASPQEIRLVSLEKCIEETQDVIKRLQTFWLREQKNLLRVSKERQEQIHSINLLKKQTLILEHKNLKINNEIEAYKKNEEKVAHTISNLVSKSTVLCETLFHKQKRKQNLNDGNTLLQTEYDCKLKDSELACLKIEADIAEIEEDKATLSKEIIEVNREALEWEKHMKLAKDTTKSMKEERMKGGEGDKMRQEIHRMTVIYSHLKRAQEKLMKDLEYSVSRRDCIFTTSEAHQKINQAVADKTRINYTRKMDNIRNKIKQNEDEAKKIKDQIETLVGDYQFFEGKIVRTQGEANAGKDYRDDLIEQLELSKTNRQLNFELLLIQQKKLNMYNDIARGRTPFRVYKTEDQLVTQYENQKDLNNRISKVIQSLMNEFPARNQEMTRLMNSLKINVFLFKIHLQPPEAVVIRKVI